MKRIGRSFLVTLLSLLLTLSPRLALTALAQGDAASADDVKAIRSLAEKGYLGDKKELYLSAKAMSDDDVTAALLTINEGLSLLDLATLKPGDKTYRVEDLQNLLSMVDERSEDIVAHKVSAWKYKKRVEKMIALLGPTASSAAPAATAPEPTAVPKPTSTATPIPGPNKAEWDQMRDDLKDMSKRMGDLQTVYDKKVDAVQKSNEDTRRSNEDMKTASAETQEQLKLVKKLLDRVQGDLSKTEDRLDEVAKKAAQKSMTDIELQQELSIMHKDLRDNSQDVSVLKQEIAKLDKSGEEKAQSPLDDLLGSKWVAGGALVVGVTALVIALTKK